MLNIFFIILLISLKKTTQIKNITLYTSDEVKLSDPSSNQLLFYLPLDDYSKNSKIYFKIIDSNYFNNLEFKYSFLDSQEEFDSSFGIVITPKNIKNNEYEFQIKNTAIINVYLAFLITSNSNFEYEVTFKVDSSLKHLNTIAIIIIVISVFFFIGIFALCIICVCKLCRTVQKHAVSTTYGTAMYMREIQRQNVPYYQGQFIYNQNMQGQIYYNNLQGQNFNENYMNLNHGNSNLNLNDNNLGIGNEKQSINKKSEK